MPFQGDSNAGATDPRLLQLLLSQRENRARLEIDQQRAQMDAMRQAKQDERDEQKFQLDMALSNQRLLQERANTAGTIQTLVGSVGERAQAVDPGQREAAQNSQFFGSVGDGDQQLGQDFAAAVLPNDPNAFNDELALASTLTGDRMLDQDVDAAAEMRGVSRSDVLGGAQTQINVGAIADQKKLDEETAKEERAAQARAVDDQRQARLSEAQAQRNYQREISQVGNEVIRLEEQIETQQEIMRTAPIGSDSFARAQKIGARLQSAMSKKLTENVDPGHLTNIQKWMDENVSLIQETETAIQDVSAFLSLAEKDPNFLGTTRGGLTQYINNVVEGTRDISDVSGVAPVGTLANMGEAAFTALARDTSLSPVERDRLGREMGFEAGNTLQARNDVKAVSSRLAYIVTRGNNPGRFSIKEYEQNLSRFRADRGTAAQALRNLRTGLAEMQGVSSRVKSRVSVYEKVSPGLVGGLVGSEGQTILPPSGPTPFDSLPGQTQELPKGVPDVTFGRSGLPLLAPPKPTTPGGVSADQYLGLSVEEKAAYLEKLMRESK